MAPNAVTCGRPIQAGRHSLSGCDAIRHDRETARLRFSAVEMLTRHRGVNLGASCERLLTEDAVLRSVQLQEPPAMAGKKYVIAIHISLFAAEVPTVVVAFRSFW